MSRKLNKILVDKIYKYVYEIGSSRKVIYLTDKYIKEDDNNKLINAKFDGSNQNIYLLIDFFWGEIGINNTYTILKNNSGMYLFYKNKFIDYIYKAKNYQIFFDTNNNNYINCKYKPNVLYLTKNNSDYVLKLAKIINTWYVSNGEDKNKVSFILSKFKNIVIRVYKNHQEYLNML